MATTASSPGDVFVCAFDPLGRARWGRRFVGSSQFGSDRALGITAMAGGDVVVAGVLERSLDLGRGVLPATAGGSRDAFVARYDAAGNAEWTRRFGDDSDQAAHGVVTGPADSAIVAGWSSTRVDFGGGVVSSTPGGHVFVTSFDAGGNARWTTSLLGQPNGLVGIGVRQGVGAVIAGAFSDSLTIEGRTMALDGRDVIVVALDDRGDVRFWTRLGMSLAGVVTGVAVDANGNIAVAGTATGGSFTTLLAPNGTLRWTRWIAAQPSFGSLRVAFDEAGDVVVAGTFYIRVDVGLGLQGGVPRDALFVARYALSGAPLSNAIDGAHVGTPGLRGLEVAAIAPVSGSGLVVVGAAQGRHTRQLAGTAVAFQPSDTAFVARLEP